jgi:hypothetical protein
MPLTFKLFNTNQQESIELTSAKHALEHYIALHPPETATCPDVHKPSTTKTGSENEKELNELDKQERSTLTTDKSEKRVESRNINLEGFASVHWGNNGYGWYKCAICGSTKLVCCQGNTCKNPLAWFCEGCRNKWRGQIETTYPG